MKAIVQTGYGDPHHVLALADIPRPQPGDGEVLVRMQATSINTPDWLITGGVPKVLRLQFGLRGPRHAVRGSDVAGVVEAVGPGVTDLSVGTPVLGSSWSGSGMGRHGTLGEHAVAPADMLVARPDWLEVGDAAALVMSGATALRAMQRGEVGRGTRLLINGASGGVGTFAVQMAADLGAEVTGVCSARNADLVMSLGASHVIDYATEDFTSGGRRFDVILDNVMNHPPRRTIRALADGGILLPNSVGSGSPWLLGLPRFAQSGLLGLLGRAVVRTVDTDLDQASLGALVGLAAGGAVRPVIDSTFDLPDAPAAIARMAGRHAVGNVVVQM